MVAKLIDQQEVLHNPCAGLRMPLHSDPVFIDPREPVTADKVLRRLEQPIKNLAGRTLEADLRWGACVSVAGHSSGLVGQFCGESDHPRPARDVNRCRSDLKPMQFGSGNITATDWSRRCLLKTVNLLPDGGDGFDALLLGLMSQEPDANVSANREQNPDPDLNEDRPPELVRPRPTQSPAGGREGDGRHPRSQCEKRPDRVDFPRITFGLSHHCLIRRFAQPIGATHRAHHSAGVGLAPGECPRRGLPMSDRRRANSATALLGDGPGLYSYPPRMMSDGELVHIEVPGPLNVAELRKELEAEGFEVTHKATMEQRGLPSWSDSPVEILAVVTLAKIGADSVGRASRAVRKWQTRRRQGTPPRRSRLLGPDGKPIRLDG